MAIQLYNVAPKVPGELKFLEELTNNIWWCWHPGAIELFMRIDAALWRDLSGSAKTFLRRVPQSRLEELAHDVSYLRLLARWLLHCRSIAAAQVSSSQKAPA